MTEEIVNQEMPIIKEEKVWPQFHILPHVNMSLYKYLRDIKAMPVLHVGDDSLNKLFVAVTPVMAEDAPPVLFSTIGPEGGNALLPYTGNLVINDRVVEPGRLTNVAGTVVKENVPMPQPGLVQIDLARISRAARMVGYRPELLSGLCGVKESFGNGYVSVTYELPIDSEHVLEQLELIMNGPADEDVKLYLQPNQLRGVGINDVRWQLDCLDVTKHWEKYIIHNEMLKTDDFSTIWKMMWEAIEAPVYKPWEEAYDYNEVSRYCVPALESGAIDYGASEYLQCWYNFMAFVQFRHSIGTIHRVRISEAEHHRMVAYRINSGKISPISFRERPACNEQGTVYVKVLTDAEELDFEFAMARFTDDDLEADTNLPNAASTLWGGVLSIGEREFDQYALEGILAVTRNAYRHQFDQYVNKGYRVDVRFDFPGV